MMTTAPAFNEQIITDIISTVESLVAQTGRFEIVKKNEPVSAPTAGLMAAIWIDTIVPLRRSAINATSVAFNLRIRAYMPFRAQPYDIIDTEVLAGVAEIMAALSGDLKFSQTERIDDMIRCIDLLGGEGSGEKLDARAGYLELDRKIYRIMTIRCPIIVNDAFQQAV
jgi:hypothetical protein